ALLRVTRSVPIVFAGVLDPVGAGFVTSMARPGGNATGFTSFEYSLSGKWLELLKEIAPNLTRVAVRAIKAGKISASRDQHGQGQIDPAEMHRVYPPVATGVALR